MGGLARAPARRRADRLPARREGVPRPAARGRAPTCWCRVRRPSCSSTGRCERWRRWRSEQRGRAGDRAPIRVVDLGTGSGAIALALKRAHPRAEVTATDVSAAALAVARRNAERLGLAIELVEASWWQGLDGRRFDLADRQPALRRRRRPAPGDLAARADCVALTPGGDGLDALRAIVAGASSHARSGRLAPRRARLRPGRRRARAARRRRLLRDRDPARPGRPRAGDRRSPRPSI